MFSLWIHIYPVPATAPEFSYTDPIKWPLPPHQNCSVSCVGLSAKLLGSCEWLMTAEALWYSTIILEGKGTCWLACLGIPGRLMSIVANASVTLRGLQVLHQQPTKDWLLCLFCRVIGWCDGALHPTVLMLLRYHIVYQDPSTVYVDSHSGR